MIYFFDGTKEGFLTAFRTAFTDPDAVVTSGQTQLTLGSRTLFVPTDSGKAAKAEERLLSFDRECMHDLNFILRSCQAGKEQIAYRYLHLIATEKCPVRARLSLPAVIDATECVRRVGYEIHRLHGFMRFMECESGALYAPITPDNDVCDLLAPHFKARLHAIPFVIHDVTRRKAAVCDGSNLFSAPLDRTEVLLSADETEWQALWKRYYQAVNIPSRERLKQMRSYMPVRYWVHLPEKH